MKIDRPALSRFFATGARYVLAGVFLVSALGKLSSPDTFLSFAKSLPLLSILGSGALLYSVVISELILVVLLLIPRTRKAAAFAAFMMFLFFTGLLMYSSQTGSQQPCGCFGELVEYDSAESSTLMSMVFLFLAAIVVGDDKTSWKFV